MMPICLVTGFLGTGKTTLLKRIVETNRKRRLAYLINEFSPTDVDGAILSEENPNVISIPGGSIFCRCLVSEFIARLTEIAKANPPFEGVVIEASGMADPGVISEMLSETRLDRRFSLANVVTIVEPRSFLRLIHTLPNVTRQVRAARLLLLNKCDLFDDAELEKTEEALRAIRPEPRVLRCVNADAPFDLFPAAPVESGTLRGEYAKCRDPSYATFTLRIPAGTPISRVMTLIEENESALYRVKGGWNADDAEAIRFDWSAAGLSLEPASEKGAAGDLIWICRGDAANSVEKAARKLEESNT